jgi:hypothetical protein
MHEELVKRLVNRTAEAALGPSTVRNQGAPGVLKAARGALKRVRLDRYRIPSSARFGELLERDTELVRRRLPRGAQHWGTARKCLNLFLRDILYNRFLCERFHFAELEPWLEVPLDSHVARGLLESEQGCRLPRWKTIKTLNQVESQQYQMVGRQIAKDLKTHTVYLDLIFWRAANRRAQ